MQHALLDNVFAATPELELAVLIGSRATGTSRPDSDWDFAIQWVRTMGFLQQLAATEQLRNMLAETLGTSCSHIDLIRALNDRSQLSHIYRQEWLSRYGCFCLNMLR